ncbi:MAG: sulfatase-like hydrolase/transferase [Pirellulaceae bacterium]|nr:sulfatase-like hydrolase/transferase [Planctomycetales bacterium]
MKNTRSILLVKLRGLSLGGILMGILMACSAAYVRAELPHIVWIMADDLGWSDLSCQGNGKLRTPIIDALASQGMLFRTPIRRTAHVL